MTEHIRDYLQTQNLKLDADAVRVAELAAQAVMAQGQALIEHDVLSYEQPEARLAEHIEENDQHSGLLKQLFMALDSAYARHPVQSAVLYGLLPDDSALVRLVQQGQPIEQRLATDDTTAAQYLAAHSSRTGWLNLACSACCTLSRPKARLPPKRKPNGSAWRWPVSPRYKPCCRARRQTKKTKRFN